LSFQQYLALQAANKQQQLLGGEAHGHERTAEDHRRAT
jgi:hypothetical protein